MEESRGMAHLWNGHDCRVKAMREEHSMGTDLPLTHTLGNDWQQSSHHKATKIVGIHR